MQHEMVMRFGTRMICLVVHPPRRYLAGMACNGLIDRLVHRAAKALGGVPEMLSSKDFAEHGPDERAVILYVAFLCSRLLECSKDDRAAHIIQRAWRLSKAKTAGGGMSNGMHQLLVQGARLKELAELHFLWCASLHLPPG